MNYIQAFMRDNDIQINEEFYIFDGVHKLLESESKFYFDENLQLKEKIEGYLYDNYVPFLLAGLISGEYGIEKILKKPKTVWDLEKGDHYWYITSSGGIVGTQYYHTPDNDRIIELGNAFLTKKEAAFEVERRKCESILLKYGTRNFMSLGDKYTKRYYIGYDYNANEIEYYFRYFLGLQGTIYFESEELAQKAVKEVGENRLKKYIFNVKE